VKAQKMSLISLGFLILFLSINVYAEEEFAFVTPDEYQSDNQSYQDESSSRASTAYIQEEFRGSGDNYSSRTRFRDRGPEAYPRDDYYPAMPAQIAAGAEKVIVVNPRIHAWGAYSSKGQLIRSGMATAGGRWCSDIGRSCKTAAGTFRIKSLGSGDCFSKIYPVGEGGAPMPYCMFFNGGQGLHGSGQVVPTNISHGCVRLHESDARWIRYHFATVGTKVIIKPY